MILIAIYLLKYINCIIYHKSNAKSFNHFLQYSVVYNLVYNLHRNLYTKLEIQCFKYT